MKQVHRFASIREPVSLDKAERTCSGIQLALQSHSAEEVRVASLGAGGLNATLTAVDCEAALVVLEFHNVERLHGERVHDADARSKSVSRCFGIRAKLGPVQFSRRLLGLSLALFFLRLFDHAISCLVQYTFLIDSVVFLQNN